MSNQIYISVLRGINVSGKRLIKMEALAQVYAQLGFSAIQTYVQSGNVVFTAPTRPTAEVAQAISDAIATHFGFDVPVLVFDLSTWENLLETNPFKNNPTCKETDLYVTLLTSPKHQPDEQTLQAKARPDETLHLFPEWLYLHCPTGYGQTKLTTTFFEKQYGCIATTRNVKTIRALHELALRTAPNA